MASPGPEGGAPAEGVVDQGTEQTQEQGGSIFDPYLQNVPEASRPIVAGYLKDAEKNVNSKLREAADLQSRFGDYKDIDLSGIPPEQLANVVAFVNDIGSDPEKYNEWLRSEATEAGLIQAQQEAAAQGEQEPDLEEYIQSRIQEALNPVTQQLSRFEQQTQEHEQAEAQTRMEQHIESAFAKIETDHKITLSEEQQEAILALGETVKGDDFVEKGFEKLRALEGGAQTGFVKDKQGQPAPSLRTGGQAAPAKPKSFADVREQALEIINQTR